MNNDNLNYILVVNIKEIICFKIFKYTIKYNQNKIILNH